MKKFNKQTIIVAILAMILNLESCKKLVEVDAPSNQLVTASVFRNNSTATAAMLNIYYQMYSAADAWNLEYQTAFQSDEFTYYGTINPYTLAVYTNSLDATLDFGPWIAAYNYIYQANALIEGLANSQVTPAVQKQLTGEAKFIRAFWYFHLVNSYGDVPLALTTNYTTNKALSRSPRSDVYKQIVNDLKDAQTLMKDNFVDLSDTGIATERIRPSQWAATALLARVYLYTGEYENAISQSTAIINNTSLFELAPELNDVFLANSREAIWQLGIPIPNAYNTKEGFNYILQGQPGDASGQPQSLSPQLLSAFENGDKRLDKWVSSYTSTDPPFVTYYYPFKYKVYFDAAISEYQMVFRLAEQYLIRAEAEAQLNKIPESQNDLNAIRTRAGLSNTAANDKPSLLAAILHERQVELFTEGHRWYDLVRTGAVDTVMGAPGNVTQFKGGVWSQTQKLYPIPQSERNKDTKLTQNPGY